jgi:L-lactate dehydrogenase
VGLGNFTVEGRTALDEHARAELLDETRRAAGKIIAAKGATNWAIAVATARILEAYLRDENAILTVSRFIADHQGIRDVCLAMPSLISRVGVGPLLPIEMGASERSGLQKSAETIREVIRRLGL